MACIKTWMEQCALHPQSYGMLFSSPFWCVSLKWFIHLREVPVDTIPLKKAVTRHSQNSISPLKCNIFRLLLPFFLNQRKHLGEQPIFLADWNIFFAILWMAILPKMHLRNTLLLLLRQRHLTSWQSPPAIFIGSSGEMPWVSHRVLQLRSLSSLWFMFLP